MAKQPRFNAIRTKFGTIRAKKGAGKGKAGQQAARRANYAKALKAGSLYSDDVPF